MFHKCLSYLLAIFKLWMIILVISVIRTNNRIRIYTVRCFGLNRSGIIAVFELFQILISSSFAGLLVRGRELRLGLLSGPNRHCSGLLFCRILKFRGGLGGCALCFMGVLCQATLSNASEYKTNFVILFLRFWHLLLKQSSNLQLPSEFQLIYSSSSQSTLLFRFREGCKAW